MRRFNLGVLASLLVLSFSSCGNNNAPKAEDKKILACNFSTDSVEKYIVLNSSLDFSRSKFTVNYSDGNSETYNFEQNMLTEFSSTSLGEQTAKIVFNKDIFSSSFFFKYYVFENSNQIAFAKTIEQFNYLNELTFDDIVSFISLKESFNALSEGDKQFFAEYMSFIPSKLEKSEQELINIFMTTKSNELSSFKDSLNTVAYTQGNIDLINSYINSFTTKKYVTIETALADYENTIANIDTVDRKDIDLDVYKTETIKLLKSVFTVDFGRVVFENGSYIYKVEKKNYATVEGIDSIITDFENGVNAATSEISIDGLYKSSYSQILSKFMTSFAEDVSYNINLIFEDVKQIEKDLVDSYKDITISVNGLFDNILVDYKNDNRWWVPEPYKPYILLDSAASEILKKDSFQTAVDTYNMLSVEIIKATLQKNLELYYSIWRNNNPAYDTSDTLYWNNIAEYNGAGGNYFIYNGPLSDYAGNKFASSFRLAGKFYHFGELTQQQLLNNYSDIKNRIQPPALAISNISLNLDNVETVIDQNTQFSLDGGVAVVTYNDTRIENVALTNSNIVGSVDTSIPGSKEVSIKFVDPRLQQEHQTSFSIVVKSDVEIFNTLIAEINKLPVILHPTQADVSAVKGVVDIFNTLSNSQKETFQESFASAYTKLVNAQSSCASIYADLSASSVIQKYEKLNISVLEGTSKESLKVDFDSFIDSVYKTSEFNVIDSYIASFNSTINNVVVDSSLNLDVYKELTLNSISDLCSYSTIIYTGTISSVSHQESKQTVADDSEINALVDALSSSINAASSKADVDNTYQSCIDDIYNLAIAKIEAASENAAKNSMYNLRDTIKEIWIDKGDITNLSGENDSIMTTDYLDDGGYYCWYCPVCYQTGNVYKKISIAGSTNKCMISKQYYKCLFDMSRVTMHRNILSALLVAGVSSNLSKYWQCLATEGVHEYNGCLSEYVGTTYDYSKLRLWCGGWADNPEVCDGTISKLVGVYNDAINIFVK